MIVVFVGPSLGPDLVLAALDGAPATILPPAARGDLHRAWRRRPDAIVLIDGYFHQTAAVWHKEILWALEQGTTVVGASSMGALRAAELDTFGMIGIGQIYESFRDGVIEADDEVTLVHGDASTGYRALSEPLVNIRSTLRAAVEQGIITDEVCERAVAVSRSRHYSERSFETMLRDLGGRSAERLRTWLPNGRVDQKVLDAEEALRRTVDRISAPSVSPWSFEPTAMWHDLERECTTSGHDPHDRSTERTLDALAADSQGGRSISLAALARLLASDVARRHGYALQDHDLLAALDALRQRHGLHEPSELSRWMDANGLDTNSLTALLASEVRLDWVLDAMATELDAYLLDELRLDGRYEAFLAGAGQGLPLE